MSIAQHGPSGVAQEPTREVSPVWITGVVLVNLGINAAFFAPLQVLLGLQAAQLDPGQKEGILALVTGCGAPCPSWPTPSSGRSVTGPPGVSDAACRGWWAARWSAPWLSWRSRGCPTSPS